MFFNRLLFRAGRSAPTSAATRAPRWGTITLAREPIELLLPFIAHTLSLGASRVTILLDDPNDPVFEVLNEIDRVRSIRCDDAFWAERGGRPNHLGKRQRRAIASFFRNSHLDWLAHVDIDEFITSDRPIADVLAALPSEPQWVQLPVAERVWVGERNQGSLFSGAFRTPLDGPETEIEEIYGRGQENLFPHGMAGHHLGKPLARVGAPVRLRVHDAVQQGTGEKAPSTEADGLMLLHLEGLTPHHWSLKHLRHALSLSRHGEAPIRPEREAVVQSILEADDPLELAQRWFHQTYVLSEEVASRLQEKDALITPAFDPLTTRIAAMPDLNSLATPTRIDAIVENELQATLEALLSERKKS